MEASPPNTERTDRPPATTRRTGRRATPAGPRAKATPNLSKETGVVFLLLLVVAAAVYGPHIVHGGLFSDDWNYYAMYHYDAGPSYLDKLGRFADVTGYRPLFMAYMPLTVAAFGKNSHLFLGWAAVLACLMSAAFYLLLRTLGIARPHACALAVLLLVFPAADSTRFFATSSHMTLAVTLYFVGVNVAFRGLRYSGRRAIAMHAAAVALYLLSMWSHEVTAPGVLGAVLLYRLRVPWDAALKRFAADLAAVVFTLAFVTSSSSNQAEPQALGGMVNHAFDIGIQALMILAASTLPWIGPTAAIVIMPLLVAAAVLGIRRLARDDRIWKPLRFWLALAGAGVLATFIAYSIFIPAANAQSYEPLALGPGRRTNLLAGVGIVIFAYASVQIAVLLVLRRRPALVNRTSIGIVAAALLIGAGYVYRVEKDAAAWNRAADIETHVLKTVETAVPDPPPGSTFYVGGFPIYAAPDTSTFLSMFDLRGALKTLYDDGTLSAEPISPTYFGFRDTKHATAAEQVRSAALGETSPRGSTLFNCGRDGFTATRAKRLGEEWFFDKRAAALGSMRPVEANFPLVKVDYGSGIFVNARTGQAHTPRNQRGCEAAVTATPPGPLREASNPRWPQPKWWPCVSLNWRFAAPCRLVSPSAR